MCNTSDCGIFNWWKHKSLVSGPRRFLTFLQTRVALGPALFFPMIPFFCCYYSTSVLQHRSTCILFLPRFDALMHSGRLPSQPELRCQLGHVSDAIILSDETGRDLIGTYPPRCHHTKIRSQMVNHKHWPFHSHLGENVKSDVKGRFDLI